MERQYGGFHGVATDMKHEMRMVFEWDVLEWYVFCSGCADTDTHFPWWAFLDAWEAYRNW